jgi:hypothetical protein
MTESGTTHEESWGMLWGPNGLCVRSSLQAAPATIAEMEQAAERVVARALGVLRLDPRRRKDDVSWIELTDFGKHAVAYTGNGCAPDNARLLHGFLGRLDELIENPGTVPPHAVKDWNAIKKTVVTSVAPIKTALSRLPMPELTT